jgi:hypothetical protein
MNRFGMSRCTKNRDRLLQAEVAKKFFGLAVAEGRTQPHVGGTLYRGRDAAGRLREFEELQESGRKRRASDR